MPLDSLTSIRVNRFQGGEQSRFIGGIFVRQVLYLAFNNLEFLSEHCLLDSLGGRFEIPSLGLGCLNFS